MWSICKQGDSGSLYFALLPSEDHRIHDQNHNVLEWVPIAIHRTSDDEYSYGSPLFESIMELFNTGNMKKSEIKLLHYAVEYFEASLEEEKKEGDKEAKKEEDEVAKKEEDKEAKKEEDKETKKEEDEEEAKKEEDKEQRCSCFSWFT